MPMHRAQVNACNYRLCRRLNAKAAQATNTKKTKKTQSQPSCSHLLESAME